MKLNTVIIYLIFIILALGAISPLLAYFTMGILFTVLIGYKQEKVIWKFLLENKILLLMIISMVFSSLFSELPYISILFSILYIMKVLFGVTISCYLNEEHHNKIINLLMCLGIIVSSIGIFQYFHDGYMPKSWIDNNTYNINFRAYSTFFNPNILSVFLNLVILSGVVWIEYNKNNKDNFLAALCIILSTICQLFTYSRNGWMSLCVSFIAMSLNNKKYMKYAVLFLVIFITFDFLGDTGRLLPQNIIADSSLDYRIKIWTAALKIIKDNLIIGIGTGTFWEKAPLYSDEIKSYVSHAHNIFLQKLLDAGTVGLFLFIWFIKYLWNIIKENTHKGKCINTIAFGFFVTLLSNGFLDAICFQAQISIYVWTFIGVSLNKKVELELTCDLLSRENVL